MVNAFLAISAAVFGLIGLGTWIWTPVSWALVVAVPLFLVGMWDAVQTRHAVRRNFPIIGNLRYFFELIRPELQQYFVESNLSGRPVPREVRSVVYQRAKGELQSLPFGTQKDVYDPNYEWVQHAICPVPVSAEMARVVIGGPHCRKPYAASLFNISAMSYGALSRAAVIALNRGAEAGGFYHNTGEGGLSPHHRQGGDLVWQLGTGYFGARGPDGRFDEKAFAEKAQWPEVKMIEVKLSQGAKPGKGGLLPAAKVTAEIAAIRGVETGKDVVSPPAHSAFRTPEELLMFLDRLRDLSGGKPVGFKLCVGRRAEFIALCKAMVKTGLTPDFITVDGGEGGTGAAPLEFSNSMGFPLEDGLSFVHDMLTGYDLRRHIRVIASGKVFTGFDILAKLALGADLVNSARGFMLSLGCIQALKCNTNRCPVGVTTNDPGLERGLVIPEKSERVTRYHRETVHAFLEMLGAMGYTEGRQLRRADVFRRLTDGQVKTYEELHPSLTPGCLLEPNPAQPLPEWLMRELGEARAESFAPERSPSAAPAGA